MKLQKGQQVPFFSIADVEGKTIDSSRWRNKKVYLTMLRNTACPLCSFHVFKLLKMSDQLKAGKVEVIAFYESRKQVILSSPFFRDQVLKEKKMMVVSDTDRRIYSLVGAEVDSKKASLDMLERNGRLSVVAAAAKAGFSGDGIQAGTNPDAIPADFLVNEDGTIAYAHYGRDGGDNLDLEIVTAFAAGKLV